MKNKYRFSIIIPVHNAEDRLSIVLNSVTCQNFTDYELICVCDSCTDQSADICKQYGAKTINVNYGNDGLTRSRGLDEAQGELILFLDDDDWWIHPYVLEYLDKMFSVFPDTDIFGFAFYFQHKGGYTLCQDGNRVYPAVWNKCYKRKFIGKTRFPNKYPDSDLYFTRELFAKNPKFMQSGNMLYYYNYLRIGSISEGELHHV